MSAPTPSNFHFYERIFTTLNSTLTGYVSSTASDIINAITPVATTLITIYVMLWGWSMMRGVISEPITDGVGRIIRLTIISAIALNVGRYNGFLADWLWNSPDAIASVIASGYSNSVSNAQFLDGIMSRLFDFGEAFRLKAMTSPGIFPDFSLLLTAFAIWGAGLLATGYSAFLLILAKMALAVILAIGPIFVLLTIFESMRRFFDAWIGQALNFVFLVMLTAATIKLILTILQMYLSDASGKLIDPAIDLALPAIVICVVGFLVLVQAPSIASALGGGVAISTLGVVGWALNKLKGAATSGANLLSGKTLSDMRAARRARVTNARWAARNPGMTYRAASAAGAAPMAVYRKITGSKANKAPRG